MKKIVLLMVVLMMSVASSFSQHYSAIHGSNYSGALGVYNNPATIVNAPYKWDVTLFGTQFQTITNAVRGPNFPFNLSPSNEYDAANGNYKRFGDLNFNLRLLNTRIKLSQSDAVAFGVNLRSNTFINTSEVNYNDSIFGPRTFLFYNEANAQLEAKAVTSSWMEFYLAYARTVWDNETSQLNAGATLKILRGMAGGFADVNDVSVQRTNINDQVTTVVTGGQGSYGYSSNFGNGDAFEAADLFKGIRTGFALDLGAEYHVKTQAVGGIFDDESDHDYDWKIGVSLLDLGWNNFLYSDQSRSAAGFANNVDGQVLTDKFRDVENVSTFNDSVATMVSTFDSLSGNFKIFTPARAVINVDKYLSGNFFLNAELSVNMVSGNGANYAVREPRFLTVTPRWETRKLGFFLPVQVTRHGNFWIGGAIKAGPLLLGTHNLLNAFSKNKYVAGGAYIALTIRPVSIIRSTKLRQYDCPEY
jgi:hypothetical protein